MKEDPGAVVPYGTLREALSRRRTATSLRVVAAEVGLNATTVLQLLRGSVRPRPTTLHKLRAWYAGQPAHAPEQAALDTLLGRIPHGPHRARAAEMVRTALRLGYEAAGLRVPGWMRRRTPAELRAAPPATRLRTRPGRETPDEP